MAKRMLSQLVKQIICLFEDKNRYGIDISITSTVLG